MDVTRDAGAAQNSEEANGRRQLVEAARKRWQEKLYDLGRRNNLLYFRDLKTGSLRFNGIPEISQQRLATHGEVALSELLGESQDLIPALAKARAIRDRALSNREEKGLETCYLAIGFASWQARDGGRNPRAPVWLLPVQLEPAGREARDYLLKRTGDFLVNPLLVYLLRTDFGVALPVETESDAPSDQWPELAPWTEWARNVPQFQVDSTVVLSNFSFQKMAMVQDLSELGDVLVDNPLIAAMAGDTEAAGDLFGRREELVDSRSLDQIPPADEFSVLDADSSQQTVIRAVALGRSGVILGPPGTGKSQTIVNIIAECAARGRSILFVAEKRAALDVVLRRLQDAGLGHLALDLHAAEQSKQRVAGQLAHSLDSIRRAPPVETAAIDEQLMDRRTRLNEYVQHLHQPQDPVNLSFYQLQGLLAQHQAIRVETRWWTRAQLKSFTPDLQAQIEERMDQLAALQHVYRTVWGSARLHDDHAVAEAIAAVQRLHDRVWPELVPHIAWALEGAYAPVASIAEMSRWFDLFGRLSTVWSSYQPTVYHLDLDSLASALAPGQAGWLQHWVHRLLDPAYQEAIRILRAQHVSGHGPANPAQDVATLRACLQQWRALGGLGQPEVPPHFDRAGRCWSECRATLTQLARYGLDLTDLSLPVFSQTIAQLAQDSVTPYQIRHIARIIAELQENGLDGLVAELQSRAMPLTDWGEAFRYAFYASWVHAVLAEDSVLQTFNRETQERYVEEFRAADRDHLRATGARVCRRHAEQAIRALNEYPEEAVLVRRESQKRARYRPIRRLLQEAPHVVLALRPCWVASPLTVSQVLPARSLFDVVLFDEASQVLPEEAVPTIARGRQWVVAGDNRQLPPTVFFAAGTDDYEEEDEGPPEGFESLLDQIAGMTAPWPLQWHYRSHDERLIAFSNAHMYDRSLVTFPGCGQQSPIQHVLVPQVVGSDRERDSVSTEVTRVVSLILAHAEQRPDESLGVITMGIKHMERIRLALDDALRQRVDLDPFFSPQRPEPFFLKNLERVQGDERDAIILSIGYGKDATGRLPYRFGPLLHEGGERRLNVAITRARKRMTVVSSFDHRDMDPARCRSRGTQLLREFLEYAATRGESLRVSTRSSDDTSLNPFEQAVFEALRAQGLPVEPQWGVSSYRLDFAVAHPHRPGEFVLAIECDGASYHSAPTARDRDRLRQQQLEALGWRFHRIWSTDWFRDPAGEMERVMAAYAEAVRLADAGRPRALASRHVADTVPPPATAQPSRGPQPVVAVGIPIDEHPLEKLVQLVAWVQADGLMRTDEEIVQEILPILGFKRRGPRIQARLQAAIAAWRRQHGVIT